MTILCQGLELGRFLMLQPIGHCFSFLSVSLRDPCPFGDIVTVSFRSVCVEAPAMRSCRGRCRSALLRGTVYGVYGAPGLPPPSPLCTVLSFSSLDPVPRGGVPRAAEGWACHSEHGAGARSRHAGSPRLCSSFGGGRGHSVHRRGSLPGPRWAEVDPGQGRERTVLLLLTSRSSHGEPGRSS